MCEVDLLLWLDSVDSVFDLDRFFPYAAVSQRIMLRILQSLGIHVNLEIVLPVRAKNPILLVLVVCVNRRKRPADWFVAEWSAFSRSYCGSLDWFGLLVHGLETELVAQVEVFLLKIEDILVQFEFLLFQVEDDFIQLTVPALQVLDHWQHFFLFRVELFLDHRHFFLQVIHNWATLVVVKPQLPAFLLEFLVFWLQLLDPFLMKYNLLLEKFLLICHSLFKLFLFGLKSEEDCAEAMVQVIFVNGAALLVDVVFWRGWTAEAKVLRGKIHLKFIRNKLWIVCN